MGMGWGTYNPISLPYSSPQCSLLSDCITHLFISLTSLSFTQVDTLQGQEFCLCCLQLFPCKCSVSICHMNETVWVVGNPPDGPWPFPGQGVYFGSCCNPALATPGTSQEPDRLPLSPFPQKR